MLKRKGFTLIELLVVIAIIGLLSTLAVVALQSTRAKARDAKRIADLTQISKALELYYADNDQYPLATNLCFGEYNFYSGASNPSDVLNGGCNASNEWESLGGLLNMVISDDPLRQANAYYPIEYNNEYGYVYAVEADGQSYDLVTKLETNHDERCGLKNYTIYTNSLGGGNYTGFGKGNSLCPNAANQKFYLYSVPH